jgi:ribose-phosphate pyrophosphokinase
MSDCDSYYLFSGSSHPQLTQEIASILGCDLGKMDINTFPDGEIGVQILSNVRGKDVFVLQSTAKRPNHYLMELLIIVDALKRASAKSITTLIPYFGYARQDRKDVGRSPITAKLVANILEKAGVTRVLTMDLHAPQIQGFFDIPVDNLSARFSLVNAIKKTNSKTIIVVSPDLGSNKMARAYANDLNVEIAIIDKKRISSTDIMSKSLFGDVEGKEVLIVDDICSTGETLKAAFEVCKKAKATKIYAAISHYVGDEKLFENSCFEKIYITNTVASFYNNPKIKIISVAEHFSQAIECVLNAKSISSLYR